tara:strand:+ start:89 stop:1384 length:1296 start_codon:yes stop_codon:yes gene_type:complete
MYSKYSHSFRKILLSILLSFCFVNSQHTVDSIGVSNDSLKSEYDLLNKMISDLEILIQTNQSLENEKIHQLEKSITNQSTNFDDKVKNIHSTIEQIKGELNSSVTELENNVNSNVTNSNSQFEELKSTINSLSDSLLTTASSIYRMKQQDSFDEAFLKARLVLGQNQEFEWNSKRYSTNCPDESKTPPLVFEIESIKESLKEKSKELDNAIVIANNQIATLDEYIDKVNAESISKIQSLDDTISDRTLYWIIAILILLLILVAVFFFLKSKVSEQQDSLSTVKDIQGKLEKETIQLDTKLIRILEQKLEVAQQQPQQTKEVDHSLPIKLSEEIHRMRKRLITMPDECEREKKVLSRRLESLEEKLNDMGYEIVNLEGQTFNEGMTVEARFIPDENLKDGEEIITRVIKPQINYKDTLIQAAQVEVAQGIKS